MKHEPTCPAVATDAGDMGPCTCRFGKEDIWVTADGREIPLGEMYTYHIGNAKAVLRNWRKGERDPARQADLKAWYRRFNRELSRRMREMRRGKKDAETD